MLAGKIYELIREDTNGTCPSRKGKTKGKSSTLATTGLSLGGRDLGKGFKRGETGNGLGKRKEQVAPE